MAAKKDEQQAKLQRAFQEGHKHGVRQARKVVEQHTGEQTQYKEVEVDVKASSRAKAHKEKRRVKSARQKHVEGLTDTERNEAFPGGEKPKLRSTGEEKHVPAEDVEIPSFFRQLDHPLTAYPSDQLAQIAAQYAHEILNTQGDRVSPRTVSEKQAIDKAIQDVRSVARYQTPKTGQAKKSINITDLTPGKVRKAGFDPVISKISASESEAYFGTPRRTPKTNVGKRQSQVAEALRKKEAQKKKDLEKTGLTNAPKSGQAYTEAGPPKKMLKAGQEVTKSKVSAQQFLRNMPQDEKDWVQTQMTHPKGLFFGAKNNQVPGAYRKWQRYVNARQAGYEDRDNISQWLTADNRGRKATNESRHYKQATDQMVKDRYTKGIVSKEGRKSSARYQSAAPSHEDFGVGIRAPGIPSDSQLKEAYPQASAKEIFEIKQSAVQSAHDQFMSNTREVHEQRQAELLGRSPSDTGAENSDRVVFFTTSVGHPAVSVSANSLVGQYIIKKRKKMLVDTRQNTRAQVKGEFPYAVRDQHLVEVATGLSFGAQGRWGAFRHAGYRVGSKSSKGYGKMLPVGSQVMRGSTGQPMYDSNGNLRYTEGMTRPFDARTSKEVGLRVYLG